MPRKSQSKANAGPKARKISINAKKDWKNILKQVEKQEVPLEFVRSIMIKLIDGTDISIDVPALLESSEAGTVEEYLNEKFAELDAYIQSVDFFINVESVTTIVQSSTDELFKKLS
jgi:hypothetical protein